MKERILFKDEYFALVLKSTGEDAQTFFKGFFCGKKYVEAVNRLDKPVSGLVIVAFSQTVHTALNKLFNNRRIEKEYWAICKKKENLQHNKLKIIENYLSFNSKIQKGFVCKSSAEGKKASLYWELAGTGEHYNFLRIIPITGRTHQIRIQLANLGMPIKGDIKYGFERTEKSGGIRLHAYSLKFVHPVTNENIVCSVLPPNQDALWTACTKACLKKQGAAE